MIGFPPKLHRGYTKSLPEWLCDVLWIREHGSPKVICCFKNEHGSDADHADQIRYALKYGRELKAQFLMSAVNAEHLPLHFHFDLQVLTLTEDGSVCISWSSSGAQPVTCPDTADQSQYEVACIGLAEMLLQTDNSLKNCRGEMLMEHLTAEQARIILERNETILIVRGKSGTGKTAVALTMIQEAKAMRVDTSQDILYICASAGVHAYVESQQLCTVWKMNRTDSLTADQKSALEAIDLVVVDDAHAIIPGEHWEEDPEDLYNILFRHSANTQTDVAIFLDPFQDFRDQIPEEFDEKLRKLAVRSTGAKIEPEQIQIYTLKKRIRNSRGIHSFVQAAQKQANFNESVTCLNERDGDDVTYSYIGSSMQDIASSVDAMLQGLTQ